MKSLFDDLVVFGKGTYLHEAFADAMCLAHVAHNKPVQVFGNGKVTAVFEPTRFIGGVLNGNGYTCELKIQFGTEFGMMPVHYEK